MHHEFLAISGPAEGQLREKGSRFLSFAFRAGDEHQIANYLDALRKKYFDATHHCYAWRLGHDGNRFRANDDGEPGHSAGDPILGQIRSRNLTEVLVVVVRYYGGTNLGVGGLVKAYRESAAMALDAASIIAVQVKYRWKLRCAYQYLPDLMKLVKSPGHEIIETQIGEDCTITAEIPAGFDLEARIEALATRGIRLTCERLNHD